MDVYALAAQKGGVGKTTLAGHLAVEAAQAGPVVLVDTDPQGSLGHWKMVVWSTPMRLVIVDDVDPGFIRDRSGRARRRPVLPTGPVHSGPASPVARHRPAVCISTIEAPPAASDCAPPTRRL